MYKILKIKKLKFSKNVMLWVDPEPVKASTAIAALLKDPEVVFKEPAPS